MIIIIHLAPRRSENHCLRRVCCFILGLVAKGNKSFPSSKMFEFNFSLNAVLRWFYSCHMDIKRELERQSLMSPHCQILRLCSPGMYHENKENNGLQVVASHTTSYQLASHTILCHKNTNSISVILLGLRGTRMWQVIDIVLSHWSAPVVGTWQEHPSSHCQLTPDWPAIFPRTHL